MELTKARAKKIGVEVWDYLAKHGEVDIKQKLPNSLWDKIKNMRCYCPCCEFLTALQLEYPDFEACSKCPLSAGKEYFDLYGSGCKDYHSWDNADKETRAHYAAIIRDKIKAWKI